MPVVDRKVAEVLERAGLRPGQPLRQGPAGDPGDLPARRAVPDRPRRPLTTPRSACCTCRSGAGPGCSCAGTTTAASCPAWSTCPATGTRPQSGCASRRSCWRGLRRHQRRLHDPGLRVGAGPAALRRARASRHDRVPRRRRRAARARGSPTATRTWDEDLAEVAARASSARRAAHGWSPAYGRGFPEAYKEDFTAACGGRGRRARWSCSTSRGELRHAPLPGAGAAPTDERRFKLYRDGEPLSLSAVLPVFSHLGVEVVDERPVRARAATAAPSTSTTSGCGCRARGVATAPTADAAATCSRTRSPPSGAARPRATASTPSSSGPASPGARSSCCAPTRSTCARPAPSSARSTSSRRLLANVAASPRCSSRSSRRASTRAAGRADDERGAARPGAGASRSTPALDERGQPRPGPHPARASWRSIQATLRTNFFQRDEAGSREAYVPFKLDPQAMPDLPAPRPAFEIWVYSPRVEGVHLRFGAVARGGLRWSDRREDFRTEILGLVKAQMVKNAVIVPTGAKGGFVAKQAARPDATARLAGRGRRLLPDVHLGPARRHRQPRYGGARSCRPSRRRAARRRRHLPGRRRRQGHRDVLRHRQRGRADVRLLARRRVRLRRLGRLRPQGDGHHRPRRLGVGEAALPRAGRRHPDARTSPSSASATCPATSSATACCSREHIRLVAAFDHRHIFIDPNPDAATSFAERRRLFDLPRSSWADYDTSLISAGGGVCPRTAKSIPITRADARRRWASRRRVTVADARPS